MIGRSLGTHDPVTVALLFYGTIGALIGLLAVIHQPANFLTIIIYMGSILLLWQATIRFMVVFANYLDDGDWLDL